ncbi:MULTISPECIES: HAD family hydrolase [Mesorhizobium]|uniref:HAD family hydrolase n=1 Tax=Mesorhizobium denitrificans TaxID=2294114 RepID=A0A371X6G3_9HYPH|nr:MULTISPECIES: HAD family hydrolase [Mesorhizobium]RFC64828.1 HAD family hydrolase [Mesorhizobium denitrificans]
MAFGKLARRITTVGFDADDTLWENFTFYRSTEDRLAELLADYVEPGDLRRRLLEAERRNLGHYGFGIKGFTLSMIETAVDVSEGRVQASVIADIVAMGRDMLSHPIEPLPYAREAVEALAGRYRLVLITKGDLFHQERKLAQSGLGELFDGVEIVSDKNRQTYERIFRLHGDGAERALMVGNSLKSDVVPAIEAGGFGVLVPHEISWELEHADEPSDNPHYHRIADLGELAEIVDLLAEEH